MNSSHAHFHGDYDRSQCAYHAYGGGVVLQFNQDESIELSNTGPDVAPYYTIGRSVLAILLVTLIGYRLYDATAWVFVR